MINFRLCLCFTCFILTLDILCGLLDTLTKKGAIVDQCLHQADVLRFLLLFFYNLQAIKVVYKVCCVQEWCGLVPNTWFVPMLSTGTLNMVNQFCEGPQSGGRLLKGKSEWSSKLQRKPLQISQKGSVLVSLPGAYSTLRASAELICHMEVYWSNNLGAS